MADAVARGVPLGSGGSRLLRGNAPEHEGLEAKAADFFRTQAALFLANGYVANLALFSTLPQRGDLIVADELIHASVHDGIRMSKATAVFARHNDVQGIADLIAAFRAEGGKGRVWIAVETLYSMDGDMASLTDLAKLAARHEAMLLLDEAPAHLDAARRAALFDEIEVLGREHGLQAFMTGTERPLFEGLEGRARFVRVAAGGLAED